MEIFILLILHVVLCSLKTTLIEINFVSQCVHNTTQPNNVYTTQLTRKAVAVFCDTVSSSAGSVEEDYNHCITKICEWHNTSQRHNTADQKSCCGIL